MRFAHPSRPLAAWLPSAMLAILATAATSAVACPAWQASATYVGGQFAALDGQAYRANWWTRANPSTAHGPAGSGQPWTQVDASACGGTTPPVTQPPVKPPEPPVTGGPGPIADQTGRAYTGYYMSWLLPAFSAAGKTPEQIYRDSAFARIPATYTHVMLSFANPDFRWHGLGANTWNGTGLHIYDRASPADVKAAIQVLKQRNLKVLLAVGGASYNDWNPLAAEGAAGGGPITTALARVMTDLGFDGLDVDYEADADLPRYANAIKAMRRAVDQAGGGRILTAATWSTGADCSPETANDPDCHGKVSYSGSNTGRERLMARLHPDAMASLDMINIMTYDAGYTRFDPVLAYRQYRALFGARAIVSPGLQTSPESWGDAVLVVKDADAQCLGSRLRQDQYGNNLDQPYSAERLLNAVRQYVGPNRNPRDGAMLWAIQKSATGRCGAAPVASPGTLGQEVSRQFSLPEDSQLTAPEYQ